MKLAAIALDYDGTIAVDGELAQEVRHAIGEVRRRGIAVVLVTGRRLTDLRRLAGDLTLFDAVVAENGAVLEFPSSGRHLLIGHPPRPEFVAELKRRQLDIAVGESVVEADAPLACRILDIVRTMEQPLILSFNRSRLMVLPQAIAKSTGLRQALTALRLSIHNTIGIGDAENDHDLLDACEVGVAVGWGSTALRAVADEVIGGTGPEAVAAYIRRVAAQPRLSAAQMGRRQLLLGHSHDGQPVNLAIRGRTVLIAGEPGTGKSWLAGSLCEQLILQGYCVCLIDAEGDYRDLEALPGVITLGGNDPPPHAYELTRALRHPDVSVVVDLSKLTHAAKREYLGELLPLLARIRRRTGLPHKILVDEAHYFLSGRQPCECIDPELAGYIFVTYRISALDPAIRAASDCVVIVTRETDRFETEALQAMCPPAYRGAVTSDTFRDLAGNEAALLPGAAEARGIVRPFRMAPRLTAHVRHKSKYLDMPVADAHAFVFTGDGHTVRRARTLKTFVGLLVTLPAELIEGHVRRHDFSRWMNDVFRDHQLAAHLRTLEERLAVDRVREIAEAIAQAIRARYETAADRDRTEAERGRGAVSDAAAPAGEVTLP